MKLTVIFVAAVTRLKADNPLYGSSPIEYVRFSVPVDFFPYLIFVYLLLFVSVVCSSLPINV